MNRFRFYFIILSFVMLSSCGSMYDLKNVNFAQSYNPLNKTNSIETSIFHLTDSASALNIRFNQSDLTEDTISGYHIFYDIYSVDGSEKILSSETEKTDVYITDNALLKNTIVNCPTIVLNKIANKEYQLKLDINNLDKKILAENYIAINKLNVTNRQNFQVKDEEGNIIYRNYVYNAETFKIVCNNRNAKVLYLKYFTHNNTIALPPYSVEVQKAVKFKPDSIYKINLNNGETGLMTINSESIFHYQIDSANDDGLTLYQFYNEFPAINTPIQTLYPLRYISTKKEYDELTQAVDYKNAVDKFWLEIGGNPDRAKSLIRKYYTAVKDANRFFTSYKEGWKTDRGMIYIVYGPPPIVYRNHNYETWIYGDQGNMLSLKFVFDKTENPLTDNDYILRRDPGFKASWFAAVDIWRR